MPKMLIVDDEPDICECLESFFTTKGFSVKCAFSGGEAIERILEAPPDILLLDLRLPDVWGIEILKRVRRLFPATKVIVVSACDQAEPRAEAKTYGACGFVSNFSPTSLSIIDPCAPRVPSGTSPANDLPTPVTSTTGCATPPRDTVGC